MHIVKLKTLITYVVLTLVALTVIIFLVVSNSNPKGKQAAAFANVGYCVILDAGHGGMDGGAVSANGTQEADINMNITLKTQCMLKFLGIDAMLTRTDASSLDFDADASPRKNKNADLHARLKVAEANPKYDFISIHLNKFEQSKYYGAQVFYSPNRQESHDMADFLQKSMVAVLDPDNDRQIKMAPDTVFLMKKIISPAVTIECGFLSNENEEALLKTDSYQSKIALSIAMGYINYLKG